MPASLGKTYIALIPKKANPKLVSDFCPISLCNVCYKVIYKILANRLKKVIHKLICPKQTSFLTGCGSSDNVIVAQEIAHSIKSEYPALPRMIIKIYIKKTFDTV